MFNLFGIVKFGLKLLLGLTTGNFLDADAGTSTGTTTAPEPQNGLFDHFLVGFDVQHLIDSGYKGVAEIMKFLDKYLIPITIGLMALAVILVIVVGVQMAKAENASKAEEAKKRLWGLAIGFASFIIAVWIGALIMNNIPEIVKGLQDIFNPGDGWKKVEKTDAVIRLMKFNLKL